MDLRSKYLSVKRKLFEKVICEHLNSRQADAVFSVNGPLLVLAGAGSGKTTVLVNRINFLVKYGNAYYDEYMPDDVTEETVEALESALELPADEIESLLGAFATDPCPPWRVLAFTFTNKAAKEIKERLAKSLGNPDLSEAIWAGTFHSVCLKILRKYGDRLGYRPGFTIYDEQDKKKLISDCMERLEIDESRISIKVVQNIISSAKDRLEGPKELGSGGLDPRYTDVERIYTLYQEKLMHNNAVDFDDIIMKTVERLQNDEEVRSYYQSKFEYVLVDEYQDTNYAQFVLTKLLSDKYRNIMVVGDDDQSIYRFRGATVENILGFDKTYPEAKVVKLEQNYRSTETILAAANAIIRNNGQRHDKTLWSDKGAGQKITLREAYDQIDEGKYIIDRINGGVSAGRRYSDYAVLYRVNEMARTLETTFAKSGVPYKILGGNRFYDRKEIKDMLAYLTLTHSRSDDQRLKRVINEPKRKIGSATVEAVERIAEQTGQYMFDVMRTAHQYEALKKSADKLFAFTEIILKNEPGDTPSSVLNRLFIDTGYREMLINEGIEGASRIDNINELIAGAIEYEKRCEEAGEEAGVAGYLDEIGLVSDLDKYDDDADAVVLMTIHSAKGLEFPVVFLAGMEDGIFPSDRNIGNDAEMSEERRLAYVAITRAKEKLYISYAKERTMYGRFGTGMLSCFIRKELPMSLVERDRPSYSGSTPSFGRNNSFGGWNSGYGRSSAPQKKTSSPTASSGAGRFGVKMLPVGSVVLHQIFGEGVILSAKDISGDVLYEVDFGAAGKKKLLATYARLTLKK